MQNNETENAIKIAKIRKSFEAIFTTEIGIKRSDQMRVWQSVVADISAEDCDRACVWIAKNYQESFHPTPGQFRKIALETSKPEKSFGTNLGSNSLEACRLVGCDNEEQYVQMAHQKHMEMIQDWKRQNEEKEKAVEQEIIARHGKMPKRRQPINTYEAPDSMNSIFKSLGNIHRRMQDKKTG